MGSAILDNIYLLWWVAVTCTLASAATVWWAMRGSVDHRVARILLGVTIGFFAASYWWDIIDPASGSLGAAELRRGTHMVMWPAMIWVAVSGVLFAVALRRRFSSLHRLTEPEESER